MKSLGGVGSVVRQDFCYPNNATPTSFDVCHVLPSVIDIHFKNFDCESEAREELRDMEMSSHSVSYAKANSLSPPPAIFPARSTLSSRRSVNFVGYNWVPRNLKFSARESGAIRASESQSNSATNLSTTWLLEPIGDGDSRHIGYKIARPGAFEIASNVVTVGRVAEKADIVIPVPTVSGLHARIEKTEDSLLITDLDSTNGTFVNEKRLIPGLVFPAAPGNFITFGDTNLAIFRVFKLQKEVLEPEKEENTNNVA